MPEELTDLYFFMRDRLPAASDFFVSVIMFYAFASFKQIWITKYTGFVGATIESDRGSNKLAG